MTPPGDPLHINDDYSGFTRALTCYVAEGFVNLESELGAAVHNGIPREVQALWNKRQIKGHVLRGYVATVESRSSSGKTAVFQLFFVASNDNRHFIHLTYGTFSDKEKEEFRKSYEAEAVKRRDQ